MEDKIGLAIGICVAVLVFAVLIYNTWLHRKIKNGSKLSSKEYIDKYKSAGK